MTADNTRRRGSRIKFGMLLAVFLAPLLAATIGYLFAERFAPAPETHGELFDPAEALDEFRGEQLGGGDYDLDALRGRWTLVHVLADGCGEACRERVYYTRQIRTALGHERLRVQRVAALPPGAPSVPLGGLLPRHPDLAVIMGADGLIEQLPGRHGDETVYLVDPLGNVVMRFGADVGPEGIRDDLSHLLELSQIG